MRKHLIIIAMSLVIAGCQPSPSYIDKLTAPQVSEWEPDTTNANYGAYPKNYKVLIKGWYLASLKDPSSAVFMRISKPRKEHAIEDITQRKAIFGYSVCATVNARNSFGGYSGAETRWFLIRNGVIQRMWDPELPIYIGHDANCADGP